MTILRIDSSARNEASVSRKLADRLIANLEEKHGGMRVVARDLTLSPPPVVNEAWFNAAYKPVEARESVDLEALSISDELVDEFAAADVLVITAPIYNFSLPAQLKLWIDQVTRVGRTFYFDETGPKTMLPDRPTFVVVTSGGTTVGSEFEHATRYLRQILAFNGLSNVTLIVADELTTKGEGQILAAHSQIDTTTQAFELA